MVKGKDSPNSIEFDQHRMSIKNLDITDNDIVAFFKQFEDAPELEDRFQSTLKAGVVAVRTAGTVGNVDYVRSEFQELTSEIKDTFKDIIGEKGEFSTLLEQHFGKDGKIVKDLFDPEKDGTPLYKVMSTIEKRLNHISGLISKQEGVEETEAKTPKKGFKFEVECERCLAEILKNQKHGDVLEKTGTKRGDMQGRIVGDFVITLGNGAGKIVVESKDVRKGSYSLAKIQAEMEEAIKNRNASYCIFVVKNVESIDPSNGYFHEYGGNKLVCALGNSNDDGLLHTEILFIAYRWARLRLMLESTKQQKKLDTSYVMEKVKLIENDLRDFAKIITKCGNIESSADEIRGLAERMHRNIDRELGFIMESLEGTKNAERMKMTVKK